MAPRTSEPPTSTPTRPASNTDPVVAGPRRRLAQITFIIITTAPSLAGSSPS